MNAIEDDPIIGHLFDTPEKKARWVVRLKITYILWVVMVVIGFMIFFLWYLLK